MFFDPMYFIIVGPGILLSLLAAAWVKSSFAKFSRVAASSGITGAEAARRILAANGIRDVDVELHEGFLSDHYHPVKKVVRLSPDVYNGTSIAALGVAAHEVGHAIQHHQRYALMTLRQSLVGPANLGANFSYILIIFGFILQATGLVWIGIMLFSAVVLFQLVTLPVELDASRRAKLKLAAAGIVSPTEVPYVSKVLTAAAMTYLAAVITSVLQLVYFITIARDD
ncbi:MAG: zinc metallopeptidase [Deltaproteobacteria bacterium]|nr:MAG: zinc metallopeptidase [Deltaproteobacteria bacterium]